MSNKKLSIPSRHCEPAKQSLLGGFGLLPYQIAYIENKSQIKLIEKSRQIGMTRTQALEDVLDAGIEGLYDVYFSSNNDNNAREYMRYVRKFSTAFKLVLKDIKNIDLIEEEANYTIEFKNGKRIVALSSSPEQLHGKSGKIVLDEFARRKDQLEVWEAAFPASKIWNKPLRIISTHNGKHTLFYKFIEQIKNHELDWYHQRTTIEDAVNQGLADKVIGKKLSPTERQSWLADVRKNTGNPIIWKQQFMCEPQDDNEKFLPYSLLEQNDKAQLLSLKELASIKELYMGIDVGRYKNLTVIWILEKVSDTMFITRFIRTIQGADFPKQEEIISQLISLKFDKTLSTRGEGQGEVGGFVRRVCVDKTGMGIGLVDYLQKRFGASRIEGVTLTANTKEAIAFRLQKYLSDHILQIPNNEEILQDLNSVEQTTTSAGNIRLQADTNESTGSHADYFWALALALESAASKPFVKPEVITTPKIPFTPYITKLLKGYTKF